MINNIKKESLIAPLSNKVVKLPELIYLSMFAIYIIANTFSGTMFVLSSLVSSSTYLISELSVIGILIKILLFDKWDLKSISIILLSGLILWQICTTSNEYLFFYYYVYIVGAKDVDFRKIVIVFLSMVTGVLIITIVSALSGHIINVTIGRSFESTVRYALGTVYPTDLAARCFYILLAYTALRKFKFMLPEYIAAISFSIMIYALTDTRLDFLLMIMVILITILSVILLRE